MRRLNLPAASLACGLLVVTGCLNRDTKPLNPCIQSGVVRNVRITDVDKVDLLFVIDNSNSMLEEQENLRDEIPNMVRVLASGDLDNDDIEDFPPVKDLRIGVISTDMGIGGIQPVASCAGFGDDALLQNTGDTEAGCLASYPKFLGFQPDEAGADPDAFSDDVECVTNLGTDGCGFEQQLEAALKAVTPPDCTDPWCTFLGNGQPDDLGGSTRGHGGATGANADTSLPPMEQSFVREDSAFAIIMLTDEEDCSVRDPNLFAVSSPPNPPPPYNTPLNIRCSGVELPDGTLLGFQNDPRQPIHPIQRYVDGFLALRPEARDLLIYAVIVGVPTDLTIPAADGNAEVTYAQILSDPRMVETPNAAGETFGEFSFEEANQIVRPSCDTGLGVAFPPRRLVQVAEQLESAGANAVVQSICQEDFSPAVNAIINKIADVLGGACLPRPLNPDDAGFVPCDVIERLPLDGPVTRCDQIAGRTLIEVDPETGGQVCRVDQVSGRDEDNSKFVDLDEATGPGWFYDNFTGDVLDRCPADEQGPGRRISFVRGAEPVTGTRVRLECLQPVTSARPDQVDVDSPCVPVPGNLSCAAGEAAPGIPDKTCAQALSCDEELRTFQVVCTSDAECGSGTRCDTTRTEGLGPICVNPTCG